MGDNGLPRVVLLDRGDGEQILGLAFVSRKSSPPPADRCCDGGEACNSVGLIYENFLEASRSPRAATSISLRNLARGKSGKLKAAVQKWLRFRSHARTNLNDTVPLLFNDESPVLQEQAARALVELSGEGAYQSRILEHPQVLEGLVRLLFRSDSPNLQIHAALSLGNLALAQEDDEQLWYVRCPEALVGLVRLLFEDESFQRTRSREITMQLHQEAATALGNIACTAEGNRMIMENPDALGGLIKLLFMHDRRGAQEASTRVLRHLAMVEENVQKLLEYPISIIEALSGLILDHSRPALQETVCNALSCLSSTPQYAEKILEFVHFPRALERLISLLALGNSAALLPLSNLAITEGIQSQIAEYPNVLEAALSCLSTSQENVAMFLGNLSLSKPNRQKIVECPGFLPAMADMLFNDANPDGQEQAAWTLSNLSRAQPGNLEVITKVADWPGIVGGLVHLLSKEDNPGTQEQAARVLANLSYAAENDPILARFPDAWTGLVPLLSRTENISMQKEVTRALSNLTSIDGQQSENVTAKCVSSLAAVILEYSCPGYRCSRMEIVVLEQAAIALGNLTLDKTTKWKVGECEDAIAALLGLLLRFEYPGVQEKAAWALVNLYHQEDLSTVPTKMPQVIPILRILLQIEEQQWRP